MSRDTISIHFVNAALTGVKRLGMDVETLLSHVGIEAELLRRPKARISPEQYTRFIKMLWMVTQTSTWVLILSHVVWVHSRSCANW